MFLQVWAPATLTVVAVATTWGAARLARQRRIRLRRLWIPWSAFLAVHGASLFLAPATSWDRGLLVAADLLAGLLCVNAAGIWLFEVVLAAFRIRVVALVQELVHLAAYVGLAMVVFAARGFDITGVLAASTVVAGLLSLSLQNTLGNVIGGVAIQLDGSIEVDDWLELSDGKQGRVRTMGWRCTELEMRTGDTLIVPNGTLIGSQVRRLGRQGRGTGPRRMDVEFDVLATVGPRKVIRVAEEALHSAPIPMIARDPAPDVLCRSLAQRDGLVRYVARVWITDLMVDEPPLSDVRARLHAALERARIPLDGPQYALRHLRGSGSELRTRAATAVQAAELFAALSDPERDALIAALDYVPFDRGEVITRQGAREDWLYVLGTGSVEVRVAVAGGERPVARLGAPDVFGEMGLLTGEPRRTTIVALERVVCWRLDKVEFDQILRQRTDLAAQLSALLAQRQVALDEATAASGSPTVAHLEHERARIVDRIRTFFRLESG
jgi:small-conductance mechanosensitive channel/CRP-like cAMP-binding protein